jgi:dTDP-4-amino-4,6-dideoxygalactose transaminase
MGEDRCLGDVAAFVLSPRIWVLEMVAWWSRDSHLSEQSDSCGVWWKQRYVSDQPGINSRLDEIQAAILRVKLRHLNQDNERRERLARVYLDVLKGSCLRLPDGSPDGVHAWHLFVVAHQHRDDLLAFLRERGIGTGIHYPVPVHLQPAYRDRLSLRLRLPNTERAAAQVLSLPLYPELPVRC